MIPFTHFQRKLSVGIVGLLVSCVLASPCLAQGTGKHWGTKAEIDKDWNFLTYNQMVSGEVEPDPKVVEAASKRFVWKITWPEYKQQPDKMLRELRSFVRAIDQALRAKKDNKKFRQMFGEKLAERFGEIFSQSVLKNKVAAINACRIMPYMGKLQVPAVMDFYISIMKDEKQHEIVKMAAMRGMQHFPRAATWTPLHNSKIKEQVEIKQRSLDRVQVLTKYVFAERKLPEKPPKTQVDAIRYIRREAIKALGAVRAPAINVETNTGKIEGVAVMGLIQTAAGQLNPPPLLSEKVEAALGLCQMERGTNDNTNYQFEPSIYLIGRTMVELFDAYRGDQPNLKLKGALGEPPMLPYKITAARVELALKDLIANTQGIEGSEKNVKQLLKLCERHFDDMKRHRPLDGGALGTLRDFVASLVPQQSTELWAGMKKTAITLPK